MVKIRIITLEELEKVKQQCVNLFFGRKALKYRDKGKRRKCMKYLSYSCHYLADMSEPHHVTHHIASPNEK